MKTGVAGIRFASPYLKKHDLESVLLAMVEEHLAPGDLVSQFENRFAKLSGSKHGFACTTVTAAATLALQTLQSGEGTTLFVPPHLSPCWLRAARGLGMLPIAIDYADAKGTSWPAEDPMLAQAQSGECAAIWPIHLERTANLPESIPTIADATLLRAPTRLEANTMTKVYSTGPDSWSTTAQGGILVLGEADASLESSLREQVTELDIRQADLGAALGIAQLSHLSRSLEVMGKLWAFYNAEVPELEGLGQIQNKEGSAPSYAQIRVRASRSEVEEIFAGAGIEISAPIEVAVPGPPKPNADRAMFGRFLLPYYPLLSKEEASRVARISRRVISMYNQS